MGKQEITDIIRSSKPEMAARYGVQHLGLFGSFVREQQRKRSDIDILVSFSRDMTALCVKWFSGKCQSRVIIHTG